MKRSHQEGQRSGIDPERKAAIEWPPWAENGRFPRALRTRVHRPIYAAGHGIPCCPIKRGLYVKLHKENFDHFWGEIVRNPLDAGLNTTIYIDLYRFIPTDPPEVYLIDNMAHYNGVLLSVHFGTNEWTTVEGSAVMVAPGIALTGAHVIEPNIPDIMASRCVRFCIGLTPSGAKALVP
jgi:hypothetical protein